MPDYGGNTIKNLSSISLPHKHFVKAHKFDAVVGKQLCCVSRRVPEPVKLISFFATMRFTKCCHILACEQLIPFSYPVMILSPGRLLLPKLV